MVRMICIICGRPSKGMVREDPAHAECVERADARVANNKCGVCGVRPIEDHDSMCNPCKAGAGPA